MDRTGCGVRKTTAGRHLNPACLARRLPARQIIVALSRRLQPQWTPSFRTWPLNIVCNRWENSADFDPRCSAWSVRCRRPAAQKPGRPPATRSRVSSWCNESTVRGNQRAAERPYRRLRREAYANDQAHRLQHRPRVTVAVIDAPAPKPASRFARGRCGNRHLRGRRSVLRHRPARHRRGG